MFERLCSPGRMLKTGEEESSSVDCFVLLERVRRDREVDVPASSRRLVWRARVRASFLVSWHWKERPDQGPIRVCVYAGYVPFQLCHAPLVLPLGPLKQQVQIPVLFLKFLDLFQRWPFGKLGLEYLDLGV